MEEINIPSADELHVIASSDERSDKLKDEVTSILLKEVLLKIKLAAFAKCHAEIINCSIILEGHYDYRIECVTEITNKVAIILRDKGYYTSAFSTPQPIPHPSGYYCLPHVYLRVTWKKK